MRSNQIKDATIRNAIQDIERRLDKLNNIPQVSKNTTLDQLIDIVNKIIAKDKTR